MSETNEIFKDYPDVVTVDQVMKMLGIGRNLAYDIIRSGRLKTVTIGRRHIIPKQSVIDFISFAE